MNRKLAIAGLCLGGIVLLWIAIVATGAQPLAALQELLKGSLGSPKAISDTLRETTPLLIAGIAVYLALRAGLFNIGVEGQFTVGACAAAVVALRMPGQAGLFLGCIAGAIAGAVWALPAGWIKAYRGGHEVITTIMLNNVAAFLTTALVAGPLKDPTQESTTTANITDGTKLAHLYNNGPWTINSSLLIGIIGAIALGWWLRKTVSGYELRAVGVNPTAAATAGIDAKRVLLKAMVWSGAIGGFAGAIQVLAFQHRFYAGMSSGYGFDSLGVALLAGPAAIALLPGAFLFGMLAKGSAQLQMLKVTNAAGEAVQVSIPKGIIGVVLGVLIIIAAAIRYRKFKAVES